MCLVAESTLTGIFQSCCVDGFPDLLCCLRFPSIDFLNIFPSYCFLVSLCNDLPFVFLQFVCCVSEVFHPTSRYASRSKVFPGFAQHAAN